MWRGGGLSPKRRQLKWFEEVRWAGPCGQQADRETLQGKKLLDKARPFKLSSHVVLRLEPAPPRLARSQASAAGWHHTRPIVTTASGQIRSHIPQKY